MQDDEGTESLFLVPSEQKQEERERESKRGKRKASNISDDTRGALDTILWPPAAKHRAPTLSSALIAPTPRHFGACFSFDQPPDDPLHPRRALLQRIGATLTLSLSVRRGEEEEEEEDEAEEEESKPQQQKPKKKAKSAGFSSAPTWRLCWFCWGRSRSRRLCRSRPTCT
jgi:hypothetical protein